MNELVRERERHTPNVSHRSHSHLRRDGETREPLLVDGAHGATATQFTGQLAAVDLRLRRELVEVALGECRDVHDLRRHLRSRTHLHADRRRLVDRVDAPDL